MAALADKDSGHSGCRTKAHISHSSTQGTKYHVPTKTLGMGGKWEEDHWGLALDLSTGVGTKDRMAALESV